METMPHNDRGRDYNYAGTSQGMPRLAGKTPDTRRRQERVPIQVSEGA